MSFARGEAVVEAGAATVTPVRVYVKSSLGKETFAKRLTFTNESGAGDLLVSLNGTVFMRIAPLASREVNGAVNQYVVKSSAGVVNWTAVAAAAS